VPHNGPAVGVEHCYISAGLCKDPAVTVTGSRVPARRAGGRQTGMTRDRIVDEALAMVEAEGVEQLSMRKLAAQLGTAPTTIYWHVGGREQLLDALVERYTSRLVASAVSGVTPATRIAAAARQIRDHARHHPQLIAVAQERGLGPTMAVPLQVALARELTAAGLRGRAAGRALRSILYVVGGFIVLEPRLARVSSTQPDSVALWNQIEDDTIDAGVLAEMRTPPDIDAVFEDTLALLIASLLAGTSRNR